MLRSPNLRGHYSIVEIMAWTVKIPKALLTVKYSAANGNDRKDPLICVDSTVYAGNGMGCVDPPICVDSTIKWS